jgi:hypothetical protein
MALRARAGNSEPKKGRDAVTAFGNSRGRVVDEKTAAADAGGRSTVATPHQRHQRAVSMIGPWQPD